MPDSSPSPDTSTRPTAAPDPSPPTGPGTSTQASTAASRRTSTVMSIGIVAAVVAAVAALALGTSVGQSWVLDTPQTATLAIEPALSPGDRAEALERRTSRSSARTSLTEAAPPEVVGVRYATADLNVRATPEEDAKVITVLDAGTKVRITDTTEDDYRQVVHKGTARWVTAEYLSKTKPEPAPRGLSTAPCPTSGIERGLAANTIAVHRAVCAAFPSVSSYGGLRGGGGNHGAGRALDIMVSGSTGDQVAEFVRANAGRLGVSEVIWSQRIWTVQRAGEGWRGMSNRGSATANHYDHVHVSTS